MTHLKCSLFQTFQACSFSRSNSNLSCSVKRPQAPELGVGLLCPEVLYSDLSSAIFKQDQTSVKLTPSPVCGPTENRDTQPLTNFCTPGRVGTQETICSCSRLPTTRDILTSLEGLREVSTRIKLHHQHTLNEINGRLTQNKTKTKIVVMRSDGCVNLIVRIIRLYTLNILQFCQ